MLQQASAHTAATEPPITLPFLQVNCADRDLKEQQRHSVRNRTKFGESPLRKVTKLGPVVCHQKCEDSEFVRCVNSVPWGDFVKIQ